MTDQSHNPPALPDGLRYYLLRDSIMVPLVPVDQLAFQLQGMPRQLNHRQMSDEGWKYLTETSEAPSTIPIQAPTAMFPSHFTAKPRFLAPDHHVRHDSLATRADNPRIDRSSLSATENIPELPHPLARSGAERPSSLTDTFASIYQNDAQRLGYRMSYPSGIEPDPTKKEYCTHWIKTGECAFISIGCKFKHEMPTTEKLRELGFTQGMPRWWKEKSALASRGPTWMQRRLAEGNDDGEMPTPRAFPDPSTFKSSQAGDRGELYNGMRQPRDSLRREAVTESTTTSRSAPPPVPVQAPSRSAGRALNLLIDLDETLAPPPSPQPSNSSSASAGSHDTHPSSSISVSPPLSPTVDCTPSPVVNRKMGGSQKEQSVTTRPCVRQHSQISWASESEEDVKPAQPVLNKRKSNPRKTAQRSTEPVKKPGLAYSKHAVGNQTKNAEYSGKSANPRTTGPKSNEVAAPELFSKIEQLRREIHQKERVKKGTTRYEGQGRATVNSIAPVKQTVT
ncbi:uncharacterized protein K460DRAFT_102516 [Cucurbitaria berberidis CBS 394.84]|uniref:C3H1-type domain-containing protein n=1 Tax=Cucurbitaria berberidis CBS 394.84 TaxID=1168544 RepID=A0A9P4L7I0_9PLEO|nr:uncharacterized protein K460DRAFT_102516 [Cucurbitaria berberidis CBS 394.84]KAF1845061.1 hypothetical protein K460DRAFT_102516 [Cucurbitaria berberidis CBS 394.84]